MELKIIDKPLTVCKLGSERDISLTDDFYFIGKTDEELSLVCETDKTPAATLAREDGWRGFRIQGTLDFSLIGILSPIAQILADNSVGIFAVSTFNTDYILVKETDLNRAVNALKHNGYSVH